MTSLHTENDFYKMKRSVIYYAFDDEACVT